MSGEGTSTMGHSQHRACSGSKTLRMCKNKGKTENVDLIDVDIDDVIVIDVPDYTPEKFRGRSNGAKREKGCVLSDVICIDDDDDDDDDENIVESNVTPVTLSKGKRTYSGSGLTRNRYGLGDELEGGSGSSDDGDDEHDCEFMDVENVREEWKKAYLKRKNSVSGAKFGLSKDLEGVSSHNDEPDCEFVEDPCKDIREQWEMAAALKRRNGVKNGAPIPSTSDKEDSGIQEDAPVSSGSSKGSHEKDDHSPSMETSSFVNTKNNPFTDTDLHETQFQHREAEFDGREDTDGLYRYYSRWNGGGTSFQNEERCSPQGPPLSPQDEHEIPFEGRKDTPLGEPNLSELETDCGIKSCNIPNGQLPVETNEKHEFVPEESSYWKKYSLNEISGKGCIKVRREVVSEIYNSDNNHSRLQQGLSCLVNDDKEVPIESVSNGQHEDVSDNLLLAEDAAAVKCTLINERENLKETDEYKRAVEEEWASRQQELQIQAQEAQQLKRVLKRRRAENMRLLDMERRQKQRVEEIRETQKKDEENMNTKELLRAEIRKELSNLERTSLDMAFLLRGLGVHVNGGLKPLPNEVRIAYKKALLNFHPDRASQSDLRQQVEAEEKFKLISRMKEKFLLT